MTEAISQTFLLLATFDIAAISVVIANYAVSVSYLGRETRLSRERMEKRKRRLTNKIKDLHEKNQKTEIKDLEHEINNAKKDIKHLSQRMFILSWVGAVILPSIFFGTSFITSLLGMNIESLLLSQSNVWGTVFTITSTLTIIVGFSFLFLVIGTVDSVAKNIPTPVLNVTFPFNLTTIDVMPDTITKIDIEIENSGETIAEDTTFYIDFPPGIIGFPKPDFHIIKYNESDYHPNYTCGEITIGLIHIYSAKILHITIKTPPTINKYDLLIGLRERNIGKKDYKLTLNVTNTPPTFPADNDTAPALKKPSKR